MPTAYRRGPIRSAIKGARSWFMLFGAGRYSPARYLAIADLKLSQAEKLWDFYHYLYPAGLPRSEFTTQEVSWLLREGNVLYLSNGHRTYAKSSRGKNAYLQAIDLTNDKLIWRSKPLVCNAVNFVISGDTIICGYGFTAEPDFLYALDKNTGHVIGRKKVKSGPSYIFMKHGRIYVRTYDHDYIFELVNK
jgi:hypothetical protein